MEHTNTTYKSLKFREHVRIRPDMYIGSNLSTENTLWVWDAATSNLVNKQLFYPIALYNICDEIILNALDHCLRTANLRGKNKCTQIYLSITPEGEVTCFNNGEGIVVEKTDEGIYIPEMIFTKEMSGSNFDNDSQETIGMNGIGSKATNIMSKVFVVETLDLKNKKHYVQEVHGGCLDIHPPVIKAGKGSPFTRIRFTPDYEYFKCNVPDIVPVLSTLLHTRMMYVAAYLGRKYDVRWMDEPLPVGNLEELAKRVVNIGDVIKCPLTSSSPDDKPLEVWLSVYDGNSAVEHISFINGLYLSEGGTHIRFVVKTLLEALKPKLEKKLKGKMTINSKLIGQHLMVFFSGNMGNLKYKNQSKNELSIPESRFKSYSLDKTGVRKIWEGLEAKIDSVYLSKMLTHVNTKKVSDLKGIKKYRPADYAGTAKSSECCLFIPEGDSAESCIKNGLTSNKSLGFRYNGMFNIQGVPLNVRKAVDVKTLTNSAGDQVTILDRKKEIADNERISSLVKVLNLNYHYTYDDSDEGVKQLSTLRYGSVVIATDADVDGLGNICGLLLNFFDLFFPELMRRKFVKLLATPLIRAYPTQRVNRRAMIEEFYTADEFHEWVRREKVDTSAYVINYIKGLATHSNVEIIHMFKRIDKNIYTFNWDADASKNFEVYFGKDADKRKAILSEPLKQLPPSSTGEQNVVDCSVHLNTNTKEYQLDNIQRKIPHEIDGLNPARRKVLCGSILKFKKSNTKLKVFQLGGFVAEKMLYHHGSASLNDTIVNMAQNFCGARNIPVLLAIGQFGTHYKGGKDAGSPRYIDTKLNAAVVNILYPQADMDLLPWTLVDGETAEPKWFVPILPMAILEDLSLPATGWKVEIWARDLKAVMKNIAKLQQMENVVAGSAKSLLPMKYWTNKFQGTTVEFGKSIHFIGKYTIKKTSSGDNLINITALPPKMWIEKFVEDCQENPMIIKVRDNSTISNVNIDITVSDATLDAWKAKHKPVNNMPSKEESIQLVDHIHQGLKIYRTDSNLINMYSKEGTVVEYTTYADAMVTWFIERRDLYIARIRRERILLKCKITMLEQKLRFISSHSAYNLSDMDDDQQTNLLLSEGYIPIDHVKLTSPGRVSNDDLERMIIPKASDSSYASGLNYLLNLNYRQMNATSKKSAENSLAECKAKWGELADGLAWKSLWAAELAALDVVLKDGLKNGFYKEDASRFK